MGTEREPDEPTRAARRARIVEFVRQHGFVQVRRLADLLQVSEVTIRQDLRALDESGDVARVHGGARATRPRSDQREESGGPTSAVGVMAAAFVRRSDAIALDGGPGVEAVVDALIGRADLSGVTVHTESLRAASGFVGHEDRFTVIVPTGKLIASLRVAPDLEQSGSADLAIICCAGVGPDGLFADSDLEAAAYSRAVLSSDRTVAVVAAGGFDKQNSHQVCSLDHVDACITEEHIPDAVASPLRGAGLRLFTAS